MYVWLVMRLVSAAAPASEVAVPQACPRQTCCSVDVMPGILCVKNISVSISGNIMPTKRELSSMQTVACWAAPSLSGPSG